MIRAVLYIALIALALNGCAPAAYIPIGSVQNVPSLNDSSKTSISLNLGSGGISPSFANVLGNQNMFITNLSFIKIHTDEECKTCSFTHRFLLEMAWGRFSSGREDRVLEWFAGLGAGKSDLRENKFKWGASDGSSGVHEKAKFIQPFGQFDYGLIKNNSEIVYSIKVVAPYFISYTHINNPDQGADETMNNYDDSWTIFLQPAVTTRWGFEHFKGQFQFGFSVPVLAWEYSKLSLFASIGLTFKK